MPWPKGVKRVGYIRKDGGAHNAKGEGRAADKRIRQVRVGHIAIVKPTDPNLKTTVRKPDVDPDRIEKVKPAIHGGTSRPIIEVCPNCSFAYADGGYCPECGWTTWRGKGSK